MSCVVSFGVVPLAQARNENSKNIKEYTSNTGKRLVVHNSNKKKTKNLQHTTMMIIFTHSFVAFVLVRHCAAHWVHTLCALI